MIKRQNKKKMGRSLPPDSMEIKYVRHMLRWAAREVYIRFYRLTDYNAHPKIKDSNRQSVI